MSKKLLLIGSASVHTYNFFRLVKSYFDEIVLVTSANTDFEDEKLLRKYVIDSSLKNPLHYFKAVRKFRYVLEKERPTIIHVQQVVTYNFLLLRANRGFNIPVVSTAWGSDILVNPRKGGIYRRMARYCLEQSDYLTADAQFIADEMINLSRKKIDVTVANFGIDIPAALPSSKENIVYSNRLHNPLYRIDAVIRAFSRFMQSGQGQAWTLVVAATGSETERLKALAEMLHIQQSVRFVGWVDKETNQQWYSRAKIWISLPESDATAISMLEAMSQGCIPVVTDLPATREWIADHENGLLIGDVEHFDLAEALLLDYESLAAKNRAIIEQKASKEANQEKFFKIYHKICR